MSSVYGGGGGGGEGENEGESEGEGEQCVRGIVRVNSV